MYACTTTRPCSITHANQNQCLSNAKAEKEGKKTDQIEKQKLR
jgi:hypothetical protein